jgi:hypothetical protein
MVLVEGVVGEQQLGIGSPGAFRLDQQGGIIYVNDHGMQFTTNYNNRLFNVAHQAATALSLASTTTYTGLALWNPPGSAVIASVLEVTATANAMPAAAALIVLFEITTTPTFGTAVVTYASKVQPNIQGSSNASKCAAYAGLTLTTGANPGTATAPIIRGVQSYLGITTNETELQDNATKALDGSIILEPGTGVGMVAVTTAVTVFGSFTWEELPISIFPG